MSTLAPYIPEPQPAPNIAAFDSASGLSSPMDLEGKGTTNMVDTDDMANMTSMVALMPSVSVITPISTMGVGIFGNVIALGIYNCSCRAHRKLPFYGILHGLLWTNIFGYIAVYPLIIAAYFNGLQWIGGSHTCNFQGLSLLSFGMSTSLLVGCMGFERFLAVCKPQLHAKRVERRKIPYLIFLVWVFAVFTAFMPIVGFGEMVQHYPNTWCFVNWRHQQTVGKLYTSILAAELSGVLMLVGSCLGAVVSMTVFRAVCLKHGRPGDIVEVTGTAIRRLSIRTARRHGISPAITSVWLTTHYVLFAVAVLICVIPIVLRIILNVSGQPENHFATFLAMGYAECFPAAAPWIYMLFHRQFWKRVLPCCFSKKLTNSNGIHAVNYYHRPVSRGNDISGGEEDHEDGNANSILPNSNGDDMNTFAVMSEEGTTADILTIGNEARQHPFRQGSVEATPSWKNYVEAPNSNRRNNSTSRVQPYQDNSKVCCPPHHVTGHKSHHCPHGNIARVEYHALVRMMDEDSHTEGAIDGTSDLVKACTFGKESTI
ncbi:prostaglandin E2 receptor EP4 subtype-like [Asterias amurensis]|uniref:prostaglandin E2 receptor EP4 subtype-like n=1 Tax=Asterias amurensis TaxID=7602 RepID=UPI003AB5A743